MYELALRLGLTLTVGQCYVYSGHENGILGLALSPDDVFLASGSRETTLDIWRLSDRELSHGITGNCTDIRVSTAYTGN